MSKRLQSRIAVVTGASSGLGRAIAILYAAEGARVVCSDIRPTARPMGSDTEAPLATHEAIQATYGADAATFVKCDVTSEDDTKALVSSAVEWGGRLDIFVANAGISREMEAGSPRRIHETPVEDFDLSVAINARGVWLGNKYATAQMLKQEPLPANYRGDQTRGWIINTASVLGIVGTNASSCYVSTKHLVIGLTKQVALDYAKDKIHVNALCPGFIGTALIDSIMAHSAKEKALTAAHPWGALGLPEDIARAAVFLASEDAAWVTGHPLLIDGGYVAQ